VGMRVVNITAGASQVRDKLGRFTGKLRGGSVKACEKATKEVHKALTETVMRGTPKANPLFLLGPKGDSLAKRRESGALSESIGWSVKLSGGVVIGKIVPPARGKLKKIWNAQQYGARIEGDPYLKIPTKNEKPAGQKTFVFESKAGFVWVAARRSRRKNAKVVRLALLREFIKLRPRRLLEAAVAIARSAAQREVRITLKNIK
jgi:hypothetical protein